MLRARIATLATPFVVLHAVGCASLLGLDDFEDAPETSGTSSTTVGGGGAAGQDTGTTATGGGGSGQGGSFCAPNTTKDCYDGPAGTLGQGACKAGQQTCAPDGHAWGACDGQVVPAAADDCATSLDENCDGIPNEACACTPNLTEPCYGGPAGTSGVGACHDGTHSCLPDGSGFGPCTMQQTPVPETCTTLVDDDCDGIANEDGTGCVCSPGTQTSCYDGPGGTLGVGTCIGGTKTCSAQGDAYGACIGEIVPTAENCQLPTDEDCNGLVCADPLWNIVMGASTSESPSAMAVDSLGNVYLTGTFTGPFQIGATTLTPVGFRDLKDPLVCFLLEESMDARAV